MSEFKAGDLCVLIDKGTPYSGNAQAGAQCELMRLQVNPQTCIRGWHCYFPGDPCPNDNNGYWWVPEKQLRKLPPKDEQSEFTFEQLINWCNRETA